MVVEQCPTPTTPGCFGRRFRVPRRLILGAAPYGPALWGGRKSPWQKFEILLNSGFSLENPAQTPAPRLISCPPVRLRPFQGPIPLPWTDLTRHINPHWPGTGRPVTPYFSVSTKTGDYHARPNCSSCT